MYLARLGGMVAALEPRGTDMKKIVSFGDSFVFGSELQDNHDGSKAWAGLAAQQLGVEYQTHSNPGCGNDAIAQQIYTHFSDDSTVNDLAVINWTWTCRWDFHIADYDTWVTLGPTCVPEKLQHLLDSTQSHRLIGLYRDYLNKSLLWNKIRNLQTIFSAQQYLKIKKIKSIQTFMDYELFTTEFHCPVDVAELQKLVMPEMTDWSEGLNFLDWCKKHNYFITEIGWHPLEDAHAAAADFWLPTYRNNLYRID
jgi:hypothetical protein